MTNKELFNKYPYAFAHRAWTGELCVDEQGRPWAEDCALPKGWKKLFWQCMEDIHDPLEKAGLIDHFYFTEVKEKYATMRLYHSGCPEEVQHILDDYEYVSEFVCESCGKPAVRQSLGWITSLCAECAGKEAADYEDIVFNPIIAIHQYSKDGDQTIQRDVSYIWDRLYGGDK